MSVPPALVSGPPPKSTVPTNPPVTTTSPVAGSTATARPDSNAAALPNALDQSAGPPQPSSSMAALQSLSRPSQISSPGTVSPAHGPYPSPAALHVCTPPAHGPTP